MQIKRRSALIGLAGIAAFPGLGHAQEKPPNKIGMLEMLTGDLARYGIPLRDAGLFAIDEVNAKGGINGHKLVPVIADVGVSPEGSVQAALRLIQQDHVDILMQTGTSGHTLATIPIVDQQHIVMCNMSTAEQITTQGSKWTFRVARVPNSVLDRRFADYVAKETNLRRIAAIYGNDEMGHDASDVFLKRLEADGIKPVAVEQVQPGDPDVSVQVTRVKQANPDAIFVQGHDAEATKIIRTIRDIIGPQVTLLGYDQMMTSKFIDQAGGPKNLEGMILRTGTLAEMSADPSLHRFVNAYRAKYPNADMLLPMIQYAGMQVMFEGLRLAGDDLSREHIRDSFYKIRDFPTIFGPVTVEPNGETMSAVDIIKYSGGKQVVLKENY
jgi:branched-chain amino acid transport system substrate-binding protein